MKPAECWSARNRSGCLSDWQLYLNTSTFARNALDVKRAAQECYPFHHSQQAKRVASLQRLFDSKSDSIIVHAKFYGMIGGTQVNVYTGCGRMFSDVIQ